MRTSIVAPELLEIEGFAPGMDKRALTERDICTKFILPAVKRAGWDEMAQVREEGVTNDLAAREKQLNAGFPPASIGKWRMQLKSKPYADRKAAETAEQQFKDEGLKSLECVGGEFFFGLWDEAQSVFSRIPGIARFSH